MRQIKYIVWSIDAWGHGPGECLDYGCPCVSENPDASEENPDEPEHMHDDDRCQCHYEMNDRCRVGSIELSDETEADDLNLLRSLVSEGYLKSHVTLSDVEFDDRSCDGESIYVQDARTGEPLFQLELVDECRKCGALPHAGECS